VTIKICDAIMGSGKSSAAIHYMNENPDKRFIYITPFLDEASRIRDACPGLCFKEPSNKLPEYGFKKYKHIFALIKRGENIASTHSMFARFTNDMIEAIRMNGYTLIIDEDMECMTKCDTLHRDDYIMLSNSGYAMRNGSGIVFMNYDGYHGYFRDLMEKASERELIDICPGDYDKANLYYWIYPRQILEAFEEVYVLTYMFSAQTIKWYFDMEGLPYRYIHTSFDGEEYSFTDGDPYIPGYIKGVKDKIHITGTDRMNRIGDDKHALSASWFARQEEGGEEINQLHRNVFNFFNEIMKRIPTSDRMWTTFESGKALVRGNGYMRSDTAFNIRATNELRNKRALAYCVNVFMNPFEKNYLVSRGVNVDEDAYALSSMVQWIWRSAIRDGGEIWIYIPSSRMRGLLIDWMDSLERGGEADEENV